MSKPKCKLCGDDRRTRDAWSGELIGCPRCSATAESTPGFDPEGVIAQKFAEQAAKNTKEVKVGRRRSSYSAPPPAIDPVNHPPHYQGAVECIEALESIGIGQDYCRGNAIKYLWRLGKKGEALEDARKAQWYINRLVKQLQEAQNAGSTDSASDSQIQAGSTD